MAEAFVVANKFNFIVVRLKVKWCLMSMTHSILVSRDNLLACTHALLARLSMPYFYAQGTPGNQCVPQKFSSLLHRAHTEKESEVIKKG